ncbi:MAG: molybdenum cofactor biosynthesis F family protein [Steroidobacteraceae bacterium]
MSSEWIPVGALGAAFAPDSNALPESAELVGQRFALHLETGAVIEYAFTSVSRLARTVVGRIDGSMLEDGEADYVATTLRPGFYMISIVEPRRSAAATTLLLDLPAGICTLIPARLPTREEASKPFFERILAGEELTAVQAQFIAGSVNAPFAATTPRHPATSDLVGRRVEYTYSSTEKYEHIYLNDRFYTWQCLAGSEKGLADTDRCHYLKLGEELYLFLWREKIVPTLGIVVVDFRQKRTMGRIIGYTGFDFSAVTSFPVGAHLQPVSPARAG